MQRGEPAFGDARAARDVEVLELRQEHRELRHARVVHVLAVARAQEAQLLERREVLHVLVDEARAAHVCAQAMQRTLSRSHVTGTHDQLYCSMNKRNREEGTPMASICQPGT